MAATRDGKVRARLTILHMNAGSAMMLDNRRGKKQMKRTVESNKPSFRMLGAFIYLCSNVCP